MKNFENFDPNDLFDTKAAADFIGVSPGTLPIWRHYGKPPAYLKIGAAVRYHKDDLLDFLAKCRRSSTSQVK